MCVMGYWKRELMSWGSFEAEKLVAYTIPEASLEGVQIFDMLIKRG